MRVAVIGAGSWGTAVAWLLGGKGVDTTLWARSDEVVRGIRRDRRNPEYLEDLVLPETLEATSDPAAAVDGADVVVFAAPSHAMREVAGLVADAVREDAVMVSLAKGIERDSLKRITEVLAEELSCPDRVAALSGPNHAEEVSAGIPSTTVIACRDATLSGRLQRLFSTPTFRVYTNSDVVGVELGGASKNVIAIACGMSDGLGYGDNTKASLITRGLAEMTRLGRRAGANPLTYMGLAGMGDLIATCTSPHSRNRGLGELIAKGGSLDDFAERTHMIAEGARTSVALTQMADRLECDLPITALVKSILYDGYPVEQGVEALMGREATDELHGMGIVEGDEEDDDE